MATESARSVTLLAGAVVNQRRFVKIDSTGRAIQGAAGTDDIVGVALEAAAAAGDSIPVALFDGGKAEVEAGAAVTLGSALQSDATGRCIDNAGVLNRITGYALEAAAGAGEFITVLLAKGSGNTPAS